MSESVWDYPRPPRVEPTPHRLQVEFDGRLVADTERGVRVLETSHPPVYYVPRLDVDERMLRPNPLRTVCEFKGTATYWDLVSRGRMSVAAAWSYPEPHPGYEELRDRFAFYADRVDACRVAGEEVAPQAGGFYGGWVTRDISGPFKGGPISGTRAHQPGGEPMTEEEL